jgi:lipase
MRAAEPNEHRFATPDGELCWFEWGSARADAPSILLVHATGFHARCWDQVVAALPPDRHVVALDLPGHGRSYRPESIRDWAAMAKVLGGFVAGVFASPIYAVGHSMGGYGVALAAAAKPDAFASLMLVDPVIFDPALYDKPFFPADMAVEEHPVSRRRNDWESAAQMFQHFAGRTPFSSWQPAILQDYCTYGLLPSAQGSGFELACPPRLEASAYLGNAGFNPYLEFGKVTCPVTVVRAPQGEREGTMDFSNSPTWPRLATCFAKGTDLLWEDCTHFIPMEAPERLAGLISETAG